MPEVGDTNFWVLESKSGIIPMSKRIWCWIRDLEKKPKPDRIRDWDQEKALSETKSETETKHTG